MTALKVGDAVRLVVPENPRLDGAAATVERVEPWGCHVLTAAAATGRFRAAWSEMEPAADPHLKRAVAAAAAREAARLQGYTGSVCGQCQGSRMTRAGACETCLDCGANSGCG